MSQHLHRRRFLGLSLAGLIGATVAPVVAPFVVRAGDPAGGLGQGGTARRIVMIFLHGGASQIDTFDPKPESRNGGEFKAIETKIRGARFSEHLPGLARRAGDLAVVRSVTSREGNHVRARYLMHAGYAPAGGVAHPGLGSFVSRAYEPDAMPGYVAIGGPGHAPGYLGAAHAAFTVVDPTREVRNLRPAGGIELDRVDRRLEAWSALESRFAARNPGPQVAGQRAVGERAALMMRAPEAAAFDLGKEDAATRARYGEDPFGAGCLMARRLLEVGVPFVEVSLRGWDTHQDNWNRVRELSGPLDRGVSALLDDLRASGLLDETLVVIMGDFGRTPRINGRGGRDHYPKVSSVVMAGGGVPGGQVVGATDPDGEEVSERPVGVADLFATMAHLVGIPGDETHLTPQGRPITTVDEAGAVIPELVG